MKTNFLALMVVFIPAALSGQSQTNLNNAVKQENISENPTYKLFPTQNYWTFIKLDTRNGKMWQVHFTIEDDGVDGELILNATPLVGVEKEVINRFNLYPTNNIYNFLLLDQIDGNVYQVQWSTKEMYRGVIPIN